MPRPSPILQFPNRPLIITVFAGAIAHSTRGRPAAAAALVWRLAFLVWSAGEIFEGANWFRRLLGIGGAVCGIAEVARGRGGA